MPRFIDCMKDKSRLLWLAIVPRMPPEHKADLVVDGKLETLAEIDRLMRLKPGCDRRESL